MILEVLHENLSNKVFKISMYNLKYFLNIWTWKEDINKTNGLEKLIKNINSYI